MSRRAVPHRAADAPPPLVTAINWHESGAHSDALLLSRHVPWYRDDAWFGRVQILQRPLDDPALMVRHGIAIEMLPVRTIQTPETEHTDVCSICHDVWKVGDEAKTLPCFHFFHTPCINQWLQSKLTCPICRADVTVIKTH